MLKCMLELAENALCFTGKKILLEMHWLACQTMKTMPQGLYTKE